MNLCQSEIAEVRSGFPSDTPRAPTSGSVIWPYLCRLRSGLPFEDRFLTRLPTDSVENMNGYRRPSIAAETFSDEQGRTVEFGNRWDGASPPTDAYSRASNLLRFAPLHAVTNALIEWLQNTFDVTIEQSPAIASDLLNVPDDVVSAIRVVPHDPSAATLTFVLTRFPGVVIHAGTLHDFRFPGCGCDACDDNATSVADELEWTVRTVVSGGYSERIDPWPGRWLEYRLDEADARMHSRRTHTNALPKERVRSARSALPPAGLWLPWQLRPQAESDHSD